MNKIDKLKFNEKIFGSHCVAEYRICKTWPDIYYAICHFRGTNGRWGIRTEINGATEQTNNLPFVYTQETQDAIQLYGTYGNKFLYIVSEGISAHTNGKAHLVDDDCMLIEYIDNKLLTVRQIYDYPHLLKKHMIGEYSKTLLNGKFWQCANAETHKKWIRLIYENIIHYKIPEIDFSLSVSGQLIIW